MGRVLQLIGGFLMAGAAALALGLSTPANAGIVASLSAAIQNVRSGLTKTGGIVLPNATPTPKSYAVPRGGKIIYSLIGSLSLGRTSQTSTTGIGISTPTPGASNSPSPFLGAGPQTSSISNGTESIGLYADIGRRTATTSTDVRIPLALSVGSNGTVLGQATILYSTPKFALGYGAQTATVLGQLPSGGTQRGFYSIVPIRNGDTTYFEGPAIGAQGELVPIYGARVRVVNGRTLYEAALTEGSGQLSGQVLQMLLGSATSFGDLSLIDELSLEKRSGGDTGTSGLSYQIRADDGSGSTYLTAIQRHVADGYLAFGSGELFGDDYSDVAYHRGGGLSSFSFDTSRERLGTGIDLPAMTNDTTQASYNGPLRFGQYALQLGTQSNTSDGSVTQTRSGSLQLSATIGHGALLLATQDQRQTANTQSAISQVGYTANLQQSIRAITAGVNYGILTQYTGDFGTTRTITTGLTLGRTIGQKASLQLGDIFTHTESDQSQARTSNLQVAISRAISPAINVQTTFGFQNLRDPLNPASDGRSRTFSLSVNAPFSYGNGLVSGRVDPRLPATIIGRVLTDTSSNPGMGSFIASSGVSNVLVVLDDKTIQRTDVSGGFQFSFVTPGQHQVRVESGSLPRGVTVDLPVNTILVQGGQTVQMTFLVGTFGGIQGHVYGRGPSGAIVPLQNVQLRVDKGAYSKTDESGAYGFGRLRPGRHTIALIDSTVPAFASFDKTQETQTVDVRNGGYTTVDFKAEPLGSISGTIIFAKDMGAYAGRPVDNAYVVAEPGEHAAIDDFDGSFTIDDLPPGQYTVSVDPETINDNLGAAPDSISVTLGPQEHYQGAAFLVGQFEKKVVFSFVGGGSAPSVPSVRLSEKRLPPMGATSVTVDAPADAGKVVVSGVGSPVDLTYDPKRSLWYGELTVPTNLKTGAYSVSASVLNGTQPASASLDVDAKMPIVILQADPADAPAGSYVHVRARFLVDVKAGDKILWVDGQMTTLGKPVAGRIFTFQLRLSLRPLHGVLLTKAARLPINLM